MAQGQAQTLGQKRMLFNWGGAMVGVVVGALGGVPVFHGLTTAPATILGATVGAVIGFGAADILRMVRPSHKAQ